MHRHALAIVIHGIWWLLISGHTRLERCLTQRCLALFRVAFLTNIKQPHIVRALLMVVHQVFRMSRDIVTAVVHVNNFVFLVVVYSRDPRSRMWSGQLDGCQKAARKKENERCKEGAYFHYRSNEV